MTWSNLGLCSFFVIFALFHETFAACSRGAATVCLDDDAFLRCQIQEALDAMTSPEEICPDLALKGACSTHPTEMSVFCCKTYESVCLKAVSTTPAPSTPASTSSDDDGIRCPDMKTIAPRIADDDSLPEDDRLCRTLNRVSLELCPAAKKKSSTIRRLLEQPETLVADQQPQVLPDLTLDDLTELLNAETEGFSFGDISRFFTGGGKGLSPTFKILYIPGAKALVLGQAPNLATMDFVDIQRDVALMTRFGSKRLRACQDCKAGKIDASDPVCEVSDPCMDTLVEALFGSVLQKSGADSSALLKITADKFTDESITLLQKFSVELQKRVDEHPTSLSFDAFWSNYWDCVDAVVMRNDLGGIFNLGLSDMLKVGNILRSPQTSRRFFAITEDLLTETFKCDPIAEVEDELTFMGFLGGVKRLEPLPVLLANSDASTRDSSSSSPAATPVTERKDNGAGARKALKAQYETTTCDSLATAAGCLGEQDKFLIPFLSIVEACPMTWPSQCLSAIDQAVDPGFLTFKSSLASTCPQNFGPVTTVTTTTTTTTTGVASTKSVPGGTTTTTRAGATTSSASQVQPFFLLLLTLILFGRFSD